ncbi:hypothetical protein [Gordonia sp. 'Campus']|uniref:hypothetical protein n=1 Tax=Gordonia sp. 'Campus' TaxID=2915824 RepID=UPI001EE4E2C6|nr:hypothetical protein [Gordonia sp. 'Campus']
MIENATSRRLSGDWTGACDAANVDPDIDLTQIRRRHGHAIAEQIEDDLRHFAPDLLRWHLPRISPAGRLRPGLTIALTRYAPDCDIRFATTGSVYLVARTPPAWADAGQRFSLAVWDGRQPDPHPHPRPDRRFRLDLHRHLWDVRHIDELRMRSGATCSETILRTGQPPGIPAGFALDRWAAEAAILRRAEGHRTGRVRIRLGTRRDLILDDGDPPEMYWATGVPTDRLVPLPVLPDAATQTLPDLDLLRCGAITPDRLHPLVAAALVPEFRPPPVDRAAPPDNFFRVVECRGEPHRIGLADGVLSALDHDRDEIRREEMLTALTGTPLPCLQAIDRAHREPDCLAGVRDRLDFGDIEGALATVEGLLGPDAGLRDGPLRDALEHFRLQRETYDAYRSGSTTAAAQPLPHIAGGHHRTGRRRRAHPRHATHG